MLNAMVMFLTEFHDGGKVVIVVALTVVLAVVGLMQFFTEWQKLKLRKAAGNHNNFLINMVNSTHADNSVSSDRSDVVADTRNFALVVMAIAIFVIAFR
jgi:hypothetical protein